MSTIETDVDLAERLREAIRGGLVEPGERLVEADLGQRFGTSRAKIRDALRVLSAEGWITLSPNKGARVRRMTRRELAESFEVRELLEGPAAGMAAANAQEADRAHLSALMDRLNNAERAGDSATFIRTNETLHRTITRIGGNGLLGAEIDRLRLPIFRIQFRVDLDPLNMARSNADHRTIVAAIMDRNIPAAEAAMRAHVRGSHRLLAAYPDAFFAEEEGEAPRAAARGTAA